MEQRRPLAFSDNSLEGQLQRFEQGLIDADIEGIPPDPEGEAFLRDLIVRGISGDACIARLTEFLAARKGRSIAAE